MAGRKNIWQKKRIWILLRLSLKSLARVADALSVPIEELVRLPKDTRISSEKEIAIHEVRVMLKDMDLEQIKLILEIVKATNNYFKKQGASQG